MDSIHHYSAIAIKFSQSQASICGLRCFSASINHKSGKKSHQRIYLVYLGQTSGPAILSLRYLMIPSVHNAELLTGYGV